MGKHISLTVKREKKKPEQWEAGDDVKLLAESIIAEHHPHLADADILYVQRYPGWKSKGKPVGGQARLATPFDRAATGRERLAFVITLNWESWECLSDPTKRALLDHELCHCEVDLDKDPDEGESPWKLVGHDVEEFGDVIERHGLWHEDLRLFADEVGKQLELQLGAAPARRRTEQRPAEAAKRTRTKGEVSSVTLSTGGRTVTLRGGTFGAILQDIRKGGTGAQIVLRLAELAEDPVEGPAALDRLNDQVRAHPDNTAFSTARDFLAEQLRMKAITDKAIDAMRPAAAARETRAETTEEAVPPGEPVN